VSAIELNRLKYIPVLVTAIHHLHTKIWAEVFTPLEALRHFEHIFPPTEDRIKSQMWMNKWVGQFLSKLKVFNDFSAFIDSLRVESIPVRIHGLGRLMDSHG
jgi:hypothetical protein